MAMKQPSLTGRQSYQPMADINVTPLVDVMLVLLIIFMVTMPMLVTGMKMNLPQANTSKPLDPHETITINVTKEGKVFIDDAEVMRAEVMTNLKGRINSEKATSIRLRGDRETEFGLIVSILDELSGNGLNRVSIVTDPRKEVGRSAPTPSEMSGSEK